MTCTPNEKKNTPANDTEADQSDSLWEEFSVWVVNTRTKNAIFAEQRSSGSLMRLDASLFWLPGGDVKKRTCTMFTAFYIVRFCSWNCALYSKWDTRIWFIWEWGDRKKTSAK